MPEPAFLHTAIDIVTRAGEIQLARQASGFRVSKKGTTDLVTEVDLECERMCRDILAERFPAHDVLAEEGGAGERHGSRWRWVFDPLDGTTNYAHGLPIFCASLGLEIDGRTAVGAVYDPSRRELFAAERGRGATLNGEPLRVSSTATLGEALLATGFPYRRETLAHSNLENFQAFFYDVRGLRRMGSAAIDLCYTAAGRFDGYWELHLSPHDVAAGGLIVREAGGRVSDADGGQDWLRGGSLVASGAGLHGAIRERLRH